MKKNNYMITLSRFMITQTDDLIIIVNTFFHFYFRKFGFDSHHKYILHMEKKPLKSRRKSHSLCSLFFRKPENESLFQLSAHFFRHCQKFLNSKTAALSLFLQGFSQLARS